MGGPSIPIWSYWSALNFLINARTLLTEGYKRVSTTGVHLPVHLIPSLLPSVLWVCVQGGVIRPVAGGRFWTEVGR